MNMKKIALWLFVIMVVAFAIAASIFFQTGGPDLVNAKSSINVGEEQSTPLNGISSIKIDSGYTDINIIPTDDTEIKTHLYGDITAFNKEINTPKLDVNVQSNTLNIKVSKSNTVGFYIFFHSNVKLDVYVPKAYASKLAVTSPSGDLNLSGLTLSDLNVNSFSGDLSLKDITAKNLTLKASSGNVDFENLQLEILDLNSFSGTFTADSLLTRESKIKLSSGDIDLSGFTGDLTATSFSGNVTLEYKELMNNQIKATASSGNIKVKLPETAEFDLEASTSSGNIKNNFPIQITGTQNENRLEGRVGSGSSKITLKSFSGNIRIE